MSAAADKRRAAIRDRKLYRAEFGTFEEYVEARWEWKQSRAYQLIEAAQFAEKLHNCGGLPQRESHIRPLLERLATDEERAREQPKAKGGGEKGTKRRAWGKGNEVAACDRITQDPRRAQYLEDPGVALAGDGRPVTDAAANAARLRAIAQRLLASGDPDGGWLLTALMAAEAGKPLEAALGLRGPPGAVPWRVALARTRRDEALRQIRAEHLPQVSIRAAARIVLRRPDLLAQLPPGARVSQATIRRAMRGSVAASSFDPQPGE